VRDDLKKLPLPPEAKSYARRQGLSAMKKQPRTYIDMVAAVTNQRSKENGFKNTDEVGAVPSAVKECARRIVAYLVEMDTDTDTGYHEFHVWKFDDHPSGNAAYWAIETPTPFADNPEAKGRNEILIPFSAPETELISTVEGRLTWLAQNRPYPEGSFFVAPWGDYLIHGGTIGKI